MVFTCAALCLIHLAKSLSSGSILPSITSSSSKANSTALSVFPFVLHVSTPEHRPYQTDIMCSWISFLMTLKFFSGRNNISWFLSVSQPAEGANNTWQTHTVLITWCDLLEFIWYNYSRSRTKTQHSSLWSWTLSTSHEGVSRRRKPCKLKREVFEQSF